MRDLFQSPYVELDFRIFGFSVPAAWDGYNVLGTNLPGAVHDVAFGDSASSPTPGVTAIDISALVTGVSYYATIGWNATLNSDSPPRVSFQWAPSHWADFLNLSQSPCWVPYAASGFNPAWCVFGTTRAYVSYGYNSGVSIPFSGTHVLNFPGGTGYTIPPAPPEGAFVSSPPHTIPTSPPLSRVLTLDAALSAWANDNLGQEGWTKQTDPGTTKEIAVGGNRVAIINTAGEIWAKDGLASVGWTQMTPTGNSIAVAVGSSGRIMATDVCGATWANDNISMSGWTRITYCGDTRAIAVGGSRMVLINGCGAAYAKDTMDGPMNQMSPCGNSKAIAVGSSGRMIVIDSCDSAWASDNFTYGWTQIAPCHNAKAVAVGGSRLVVLNVLGEVWANNNLSTSGWAQITPTNNTVAIAAGSSGRIVEIDACGAAWAEDVIGATGWSAETYCGNTLKVAVG